jgi:fumarylpyruvate hydrolase
LASSTSPSFVVEPYPPAAVTVAGDHGLFPVRRIFCVGRNYAEHAREMGNDPERDPPFFFSKPADSVVTNGRPVPYPTATSNLHHEVELVIAIGSSGAAITAASALDHIYGYAVGNDLTRRDLQNDAKRAGRPWDTAKGFDHSAPIADIHPVSDCGHISSGEIYLKVNGTMRQRADIGDMIWSVPEIVSILSSLFALHSGDLIFTGTPAGVGPLLPGDRIDAGVAGLTALQHEIVAATGTAAP